MSNELPQDLQSTEGMKLRLYNTSVLSDEDTCWLWLGSTDSSGYGAIRVMGRKQRTSRISYSIHIGPIPQGKHVLHTCDTPACINPHHLFLGTAKDNARDRERKGRGAQPTGEGNGLSKLTDDDVRHILELYASGSRIVTIAAMYPVAYSTVRQVVLGNTWKHIPRKDTKNEHS